MRVMVYAYSGHKSCIPVIKAMSFMPSEHFCLQCRPNLQTGPKGACPDDVQGGLNHSTALSGRRESNGRCVEYVRPLSASGEWSTFMSEWRCLCQ